MAKTVALSCLILTGGMSLSNPATSQEFHDDISPHADIPLHAHYSPGEQGWTCNDDFRQVAQLCVLDTHGAAERGAWEVFNGQWRCRSGYRPGKGFCVPFTAPEHASLIGSGGLWECNWGFQRIGSRCSEIVPPAHGYLDASGHDWVCYPAFERVSDHCVAIAGGSPSSDVEPMPSSTEPTPSSEPQSHEESTTPMRADPLTGIAGRVDRALRNYFETFPFFASAISSFGGVLSTRSCMRWTCG